MKKIFSFMLVVCLSVSMLTVAVSAADDVLLIAPAPSDDVIVIAPAPTAAKTYSDVPADHWAKDSIARWTADGALQGYPENNTFDPDGYMTRAQFATFISKAVDLPDAELSVLDKYTDADKNEWYAQHLANCVKAGLINGVADNMVAPNYYITREQAAVIICRAYSIAPEYDVTPNYIDAADISAYAVPYIAALTNAGALKGYPDKTFKPGVYLSRAEAVHLTAETVDNYVPGATYSMEVTIKGYGTKGADTSASYTFKYLTGANEITTELCYLATTNFSELDVLFDKSELGEVLKGAIDAFTTGGTTWAEYAKRMSSAVTGDELLEKACISNSAISVLAVDTEYTISFVGYDLTVKVMAD